jgi:glycyl-tRNA synthetase
MANAFDFGPLGAQLRWNLRRAWWRDMVLRRVDTVGLESATLLHPEVWRPALPAAVMMP